MSDREQLSIEDLKQTEGRTVALVERFEVENRIVIIFTFTDRSTFRLVASAR